MFDASSEVALVLASIYQSLSALAFLDIVNPEALEALSVFVNVDTVTVCSVILELASVDVAICVQERAVSLYLVVPPLSLIDGAVWPDLLAFAMPLPHSLARDSVPQSVHLARVASSFSNVKVCFEL